MSGLSEKVQAERNRFMTDLRTTIGMLDDGQICQLTAMIQVEKESRENLKHTDTVIQKEENIGSIEWIKKLTKADLKDLIVLADRELDERKREDFNTLPKDKIDELISIYNQLKDICQSPPVCVEVPIVVRAYGTFMVIDHQESINFNTDDSCCEEDDIENIAKENIKVKEVLTKMKTLLDRFYSITDELRKSHGVTYDTIILKIDSDREVF